MRISDWSSDVCSSDLPHGASSLWVWGSWRSKELASADFSVHVTPDTHVAAGTLTRGIEGFRQSHLEALQTADLVRTSTHIAGDRKRVVEGKSVSVRGDLGGGRTMKKKTQKKKK